MLNHESFTGGHDDCDSFEVDEERYLAQTGLEAKYQDDCAIFKADVVMLLQKLGATSEKTGWAIFQINGGCTLDVDSKATAIDHEILVLLLNSKYEEDDEPPACNVRIITAEQFANEDIKYYISTDFTLDNTADCQYFVDTIITQKDKAEIKNILAPIFWVNDSGGLGARNVRRFTQSRGIDSQEVTVTPFGRWDNMEDRIQALAVGKSLLQTVETLEPAYKMNPKN